MLIVKQQLSVKQKFGGVAIDGGVDGSCVNWSEREDEDKSRKTEKKEEMKNE